MKKTIGSIWGCLLLLCSCQSGNNHLTVTIENPSDHERQQVPVAIDLSQHIKDSTVHSARVVWEGTEIPSQLDDINGDLKADELVFLANIPANGKKVFEVHFNEERPHTTYPAGTHAYIKLYDRKEKYPKVRSISYPGDANLLDMYNSIYGHGAVFENEHMAYRIYMDNRQSIDLYGKKYPRLEMETTGFYTTPEQLQQGYGCDVLWAGQAIGAGSFRGYQGKPCYIDTVAWRQQSIIADGPVRSIVEVTDKEWIYNGRALDMTQRYTIYAGRRDVEVDILINGAPATETYCTGIQKLESEHTGFLQEDGLAGSWGNNIPEKGTPEHNEWVGLGLHSDSTYRQAVIDDQINYLTLLRTDAEGRIRYHIATCAERENGGFKTAEAWFAFLKQWHAELNAPCTITIK